MTTIHRLPTFERTEKLKAIIGTGGLRHRAFQCLFYRPSTARTIAMMPVLTAAGSCSQEVTMSIRSGSFCTESGDPPGPLNSGHRDAWRHSPLVRGAETWPGLVGVPHSGQRGSTSPVKFYPHLRQNPLARRAARRYGPRLKSRLRLRKGPGGRTVLEPDRVSRSTSCPLSGYKRNDSMRDCEYR